MIYRVAKKEDLKEISKIHIQEFDNYFLTTFGEKLVYKFYESYFLEKQILVVSEKDKEIVGFILGSNSSMPRKFFLQQNFYLISRAILKELFKGNTILWNGIFKRIFFIKEAVLAKIFKEKELKNDPEEKAEGQRLLSIAIKKSYRGNNIAFQMEDFFCQLLLEQGIKEVGLSVKNNNKGAITFYKKCGYEVEKEEAESTYFIKKLES